MLSQFFKKNLRLASLALMATVLAASNTFAMEKEEQSPTQTFSPKITMDSSLRSKWPYLSLGWADRHVTDESLRKMTYLRGLALGQNSVITDNGIKDLTNLTSLDLQENDMITNEGIRGLTNLTKLDLQFNSSITDEGIRGLTNLTTMILYGNEKITDNALHELGLIRTSELGWGFTAIKEKNSQ